MKGEQLDYNGSGNPSEYHLHWQGGDWLIAEWRGSPGATYTYELYVKRLRLPAQERQQAMLIIPSSGLEYLFASKLSTEVGVPPTSLMIENLFKIIRHHDGYLPDDVSNQSVNLEFEQHFL